jgi:hypothetical protein
MTDGCGMIYRTLEFKDNVGWRHLVEPVYMTFSQATSLLEPPGRTRA